MPLIFEIKKSSFKKFFSVLVQKRKAPSESGFKKVPVLDFRVCTDIFVTKKWCFLPVDFLLSWYHWILCLLHMKSWETDVPSYVGNYIWIHTTIYVQCTQWQQKEQCFLFLYLQFFLLWIYFDLLSRSCLWRASRQVLSELGSENHSVRKSYWWFLMIESSWYISSS